MIEKEKEDILIMKEIIEKENNFIEFEVIFYFYVMENEIKYINGNSYTKYLYIFNAIPYIFIYFNIVLRIFSFS